MFSRQMDPDSLNLNGFMAGSKLKSRPKTEVIPRPVSTSPMEVPFDLGGIPTMPVQYVKYTPARPLTSAKSVPIATKPDREQLDEWAEGYSPIFPIDSADYLDRLQGLIDKFPAVDQFIAEAKAKKKEYITERYAAAGRIADEKERLRELERVKRLEKDLDPVTKHISDNVYELSRLGREYTQAYLRNFTKALDINKEAYKPISVDKNLIDKYRGIKGKDNDETIRLRKEFVDGLYKDSPTQKAIDQMETAIKNFDKNHEKIVKLLEGWKERYSQILGPNVESQRLMQVLYDIKHKKEQMMAVKGLLENVKNITDLELTMKSIPEDQKDELRKNVKKNIEEIRKNSSWLSRRGDDVLDWFNSGSSGTQEDLLKKIENADFSNLNEVFKEVDKLKGKYTEKLTEAMPKIKNNMEAMQKDLEAMSKGFFAISRNPEVAKSEKQKDLILATVERVTGEYNVKNEETDKIINGVNEAFAEIQKKLQAAINEGNKDLGSLQNIISTELNNYISRLTTATLAAAAVLMIAITVASAGLCSWLGGAIAGTLGTGAAGTAASIATNMVVGATVNVLAGMAMRPNPTVKDACIDFLLGLCLSGGVMATEAALAKSVAMGFSKFGIQFVKNNHGVVTGFTRVMEGGKVVLTPLTGASRFASGTWASVVKPGLIGAAMMPAFHALEVKLRDMTGWKRPGYNKPWTADEWKLNLGFGAFMGVLCHNTAMYTSAKIDPYLRNNNIDPLKTLKLDKKPQELTRSEINTRTNEALEEVYKGYEGPQKKQTNEVDVGGKKVPQEESTADWAARNYEKLEFQYGDRQNPYKKGDPKYEEFEAKLKEIPEVKPEPNSPDYKLYLELKKVFFSQSNVLRSYNEALLLGMKKGGNIKESFQKTFGKDPEAIKDMAELEALVLAKYRDTVPPKEDLELIEKMIIARTLMKKPLSDVKVTNKGIEIEEVQQPEKRPSVGVEDLTRLAPPSSDPIRV